MGFFGVFILIIELYLLLGALCAYLNFQVVKKRNGLIDDLSRLRRNAFQNGLAVKIEFDEGLLSSIGMAAEDFIKDIKDKRSRALLEEHPRALTAFSVTLAWPLLLLLFTGDSINGLRALGQARNIFKEALEQHKEDSRGL